MRWRSLLFPVFLSLTLLAGSIPERSLAQDAAVGGPDLANVNLFENDCSWLNTGDTDVAAQIGPITCGTLEVPENWQTPGERRLDINFVVLHSTGDDPAPDPVVYLAGGPGGSALAGVPFYAELFAEFRERRDVVLFDQRGTAHSSPLQCSTWTIDDLFGFSLSDETADPPAEPDPTEATAADGFVLGPTTELTANALLDQARLQVGDQMARCAQELLAAGVDLRQYNSVASARDTIALMRALEYETFNLYGISYGTRLALVIMREFPQDGIHSVVLDSTYPPGLKGFELYPSEPHEVVIQLFADCFLDPVCNEAYPNLKARFIELLAQLEAEPLALDDDLIVTADGVIEVMQGINGMVQIAPYIPLMISELERGETDTYFGIVTGSLFADAVAEADGEETPAAFATPVADDPDPELEAALTAFLTSIGAADTSGSLSPAQKFLSDVLARISALPEGQANELTIRLLLLDKLPATRATLRQFVERAFADPAHAADRDRLLDQVAALAEDDIDEVFRYLSGPLEALDPSNVSLNSFMFNSVECNEAVPFQRFENVVTTAVELEIPELGLNTVPVIAGQFAICEVWPSGRAFDVADRPVASDLPTLILAGTYDLQTPVSWNKQAFVHLPNAGLLIFPMSGHGVITFSQCASDVAARFIDDPIYYPDSSCIAELYPGWVLPSGQ